eukprot:GHVO01012067.1.p1 GENE.GHVO01012067.1~~GHVO01012067.1.p1  ORF type:complete len:138 (+),score=10.09 GHVO01012067.1:562-975(+)
MVTEVAGCETAEQAALDLFKGPPILSDLEKSCKAVPIGINHTPEDDDGPVTTAEPENTICQIETGMVCFEDVIDSFKPVLKPLVEYIGSYTEASIRSPKTGNTLLQYLQGLKDIELTSFFDLQENDIYELKSAAGCQ